MNSTFSSPFRLVSLLPSITELLCALGMRESLVGRSHECDYPLGIETLPICTTSSINTKQSSLDIDREVRQALKQALSLYQVKIETLQTLKPDFIFTQAQCEVCAVSLHEVQLAVSQMIDSQPQVISLQPTCLEDLWQDIETVAQALVCEATGRQLIHELQSRMQHVSQTINHSYQTTKSKVLCLEWLEPLMTAGNWVPELVELAGAESLLSKAKAHSPYINWKQLTAAAPDILILMPCGFDIERTKEELSSLLKHPDWKKLPAVQNQQVYLTDGNQYFNRPGPRLIDSLEILAEIIHPDLFPSRYQDQGWIKANH
ncbi:ABC-type transport system substrate-binding component [Planctomycetales bacterium 10988]|nr:ABC-type transport system substrate-binding component [Planctomycetales bacterium 10988]